MSKVKVGMHYEEKIFISMGMVRKFAELTGDRNPIHIDQEYAKTTRFKGCIVHGMLVAGLLSKIIGMEFPGNGSIYMGQELNFIAPIYVDSEIIISCYIDEIEENTNKVKIRNVIKSTTGEVLIKGVSKVKLI